MIKQKNRVSPTLTRSCVPNGHQATDHADSTQPTLFWTPAFGTPEFDALPADHPLRAASILHAAECWALLVSSPHIADVLSEWQEWARRGESRRTSSAVSAVVDWRALASADTYAVIRRRRNTYVTPPLSPEQIQAKAAASWSDFERTDRRAAA